METKKKRLVTLVEATDETWLEVEPTEAELAERLSKVEPMSEEDKEQMRVEELENLSLMLKKHFPSDK